MNFKRDRNYILSIVYTNTDVSFIPYSDIAKSQHKEGTVIDFIEQNDIDTASYNESRCTLFHSFAINDIPKLQRQILFILQIASQLGRDIVVLNIPENLTEATMGLIRHEFSKHEGVCKKIVCVYGYKC